MLTNRLSALIEDGLRELLATNAAARCLRAPLLQPTNEDFPDAWSPDQAGVHRLLRRIMWQAGLGDHPLVIERWVNQAEEDDEEGTDSHVAAFFKGIDESGCCAFGVNVAQIDDPEHLIGVLAHEVAHAFRAKYGLVVDDREDEEELTDVTTVFLGFGLFAVNNAHRETSTTHQRSWRRSGYLSPHAMAFALALWITARDHWNDRALAERWLEPLQLSMFHKVLGRLRRENVQEALVVDSASGEQELPPRLDDVPAVEDPEPIDFAAKRADTFRIVKRPQILVTLVGLVAGATVGWTTRSDGASIAIITTVCTIAASWFGRSLNRSDCARHDCEASIPPTSARCPRCGAVVQGELRDRSELPDALESLRKKRVGGRRARSG